MTSSVHFYKATKADKRASRDKGHPVMSERMFVSIRPAGQPNYAVKPVTDAADDPYKLEYPEAWQRYVDMHERNDDETALGLWLDLTAETLTRLYDAGIATVEQLADAPADAFAGAPKDANLRLAAIATLAPEPEPETKPKGEIKPKGDSKPETKPKG